MIRESIAVKTPFLYTLYSRGGFLTVANNYIYGPTILLALAILFQEVAVTIQLIVTVGVSYVLFALVYEIGYLMNDLLAVKFEDKPTVRTSRQYSFKSIAFYFSVRLTLILFILISMSVLQMSTEYFSSAFIPLLGVVLLIYTSHNFIHLVSMRLRLFTFVGLKASFWFVPIWFVYSQVSEPLALVYFVTFCGALAFYVYSYLANKGLFSKKMYQYISADLEGMLLVFITGAYMLVLPLIAADILTYVPWVYAYVLFFWAVRKIGRFLK